MHYINGLWVERGTHRFVSENPATAEIIWQGWAAGEREVGEAVAAARQAFTQWAGLSWQARLAFLEQFKLCIEKEKDALALLIAQETGKTLWDARSEVAAVLSKLGFASEAYAERTGQRSRPMPGGQAHVHHRPHGVMAVFGPYNFPAHLPNGHIMPALLAGNTIIWKPSELTPKTAAWIVARWAMAGLPAGVLNLLQGERDTGVALAQAPVDGVLFTGSSATGQALHRQFAGRPEIVLALEMGGNNPLIVGQVADIRAAVHETLLSAYLGSGQRCTCARRLIVIENEQTNAFIEMLVRSAAALTVGAYDETPEPFMGPLISNKEMYRLLEAQKNLLSMGAHALLPMQPTRPGLPFLSAGVLDVSDLAEIPDEEYFGPLLQLYRVPDAASAMAVANRTRYGLSAAILCQDAALYQTLSSGLRAGLINWNKQTTGASGVAPFGGIGASGNHRPAGYYAADYSAYPVASVEASELALPTTLSPGMEIR